MPDEIGETVGDGVTMAGTVDGFLEEGKNSR
jgi:hypothetical protein